MEQLDFQYGLEHAARVPALVREAIAAFEAKQPVGGKLKLEEAHRISAATHALILLNLARVAGEAGRLEKCGELAELAYFTLETAGLKESELANTAIALLGLKPAVERQAKGFGKKRRGPRR